MLHLYCTREQGFQSLIQEMNLVRKVGHSCMVVIYGERHSGKTQLIYDAVKTADNIPFVYLSCRSTSQETLINEWLLTIGQALGIEDHPHCERLAHVLEFLLKLARERQINVAIDDCQELCQVESSFWSEVQCFWDLNRDDSRLFLMMSGSPDSVMRHIFFNYSEPLYGRWDRSVHLRPLDREPS